MKFKLTTDPNKSIPPKTKKTCAAFVDLNFPSFFLTFNVYRVPTAPRSNGAAMAPPSCCPAVTTGFFQWFPGGVVFGSGQGQKNSLFSEREISGLFKTNKWLRTENRIL